MDDPELEEAREQLIKIKSNLERYLQKCYYKNSNDSKASAKNTYQYLGKIVDRILKRESMKIEFSSGGSPLWHANILKLVSKWIELEFKVCRLLAEELDFQLDE